MCMFLHACLYLISFLCCIVQDILKAQNNNNEPSFFSKGASRFDFGQGNVGEQESDNKQQKPNTLLRWKSELCGSAWEKYLFSWFTR